MALRPISPQNYSFLRYGITSPDLAHQGRLISICYMCYLRHYCDGMQRMIPSVALSASLLPRNAADGSRDGTICVIIATKRSGWFPLRHYLRHYRDETQRMIPGTALSASLLPRNAADDSRDGTICVTIAAERSGWFPLRHYLRHYCRGTQRMVPAMALSASLLSRNAADSAC